MEEQEIENLFEKIMKENVPNLAKEKDIQVQEAQSLKQVGSKGDHTKRHRNENAKGYILSLIHISEPTRPKR